MKYEYGANVASIGSARSAFRIPHNYKTTFNAGDLIPVYCEEVLPGDTVSCDLSAVCRELTPLTPVMDNSYIEFDAFFVPMRLVWDNTKQFFGENDTGVWTQNNEYEIPSGNLDYDTQVNSIGTGSLGDYFGLPIGVSDSDETTFNYLPLRAYALIYNYYYLNEATQAPYLFSKGNNIEFGTDLGKGYASKPLKVNRFPDRFISALPEPQKGPNVPFLSSYLPVIPVDAGNLPDGTPTPLDNAFGTPMRWSNLTASATLGGTTRLNSSNIQNATSGGSEVMPANLYASTIGSGLRDINSFRIAAVTQQYYETLARFGSRYEEYILGLFGVNVPSAVIQIPQMLGAFKERLNMNQVLATAEGSNYTVGSTGAFSNTGVNKGLFTFSSYEHGYILILCHIRTDSSYSQGVAKLWSKKTKFDIYNPLFANIGNVPILKKEIYFTDNTTVDDSVFGYAEAWYEYKSKPNLATGYMRPGIEQSMGSTWTYGRIFDSAPVLNADFTIQTAEEVDRTIAVQSSLSNQFKLDIFFDMKWSRIMPLYSIPGIKRI